MKKILTLFLILICFCSHAANVTFTFTNLLTGLPDTNPVAVYAVSSLVYQNGSVATVGPPSVIYPNTNGFYEWTNMLSGVYKAVNLSGGFANHPFAQVGYGPGQPGTPAGIVFWIDGSTNTYPFTYYLPPKVTDGIYTVFNLYSGLVNAIGTNGFLVTITNGTVILDGSQFTAQITYNALTNAFGGIPANITNLFTSVIYTNNVFTFANPTNGTLFINTNYDMLGSAAAVLTYASGASNTISIYAQGSSNFLSGLVSNLNAGLLTTSNNANAFFLYSTGVSNTLYVNLTGTIVGTSNVLNTFHLSDLAYSVASSNANFSYAQGASNAVEANLVNTNTLLVALAVTSSNSAVASATANAKNMTNGLNQMAYQPWSNWDTNGTAKGMTNQLMSLLGTVAYTNSSAFDTNGAFLWALEQANAYTLAVSNYFILNGIGTGISAATATNIAQYISGIVGLNCTNFSLIIGQNNTNLSLSLGLSGTNFTIATATSLTNFIYQVALAGSNNVSSSIAAAGLVGTNTFIAQKSGVALNLNVTNPTMDKITFGTNGTTIYEQPHGNGIISSGDVVAGPLGFIYGNGTTITNLGGNFSQWYPIFNTTYASAISNLINLQSFSQASPLVIAASNTVQMAAQAYTNGVWNALQNTNATLVASIINTSNQVYNAQSNTLVYAIGSSNAVYNAQSNTLQFAIGTSNYYNTTFAPTSSPTIFTPSFWGSESFGGVQWRWQTNAEVVITNLSSVDVLGNQLYDRISSTVWLATNFVFSSQTWSIITNGSTCLIQSNSFTIATAINLNGPWTLTGGIGNTPGSYIGSQAYGQSIRWRGTVQADNFTGSGSNLTGIVNAGSFSTNTAQAGSFHISPDGITTRWTTDLLWGTNAAGNPTLTATNPAAGINFSGTSTIGTLIVTNLNQQILAGNGSGLTNVNAASLGGIGPVAFLQITTNGAQLATNWITMPVFLNKLQGGGAAIYLTNGPAIYVETAPLYFTNQNTGPFQSTIIGQGMSSSVILFTGFTNQDCIYISGNAEGNTGARWSGFTLASTVDSTNALAHFTHQDNTTISDVLFTYWPAITNAYANGGFSGGSAGAPTHNSATNLIGLLVDGNNGQLFYSVHNMFTMLHQGFVMDSDHVRSICDDAQGCGVDTSFHAELSSWPTNSMEYIPCGFVVGPDNYKDDRLEDGDANGNYACLTFLGGSAQTSVDNFNNEIGGAQNYIFVASNLGGAIQFTGWGQDQINNSQVFAITAGTTNFLTGINGTVANNSQICQVGYDYGAGFYILDAATTYIEGNMQFTGSLTGNAGSGLTGLSSPNLVGSVPISSINGIGGILNRYVYGAVTGTNTFSYSVPAGVTNSYAVYGKLTVTALSVDVAQPQLVWTDETGTVRTFSITSAISATGYSNIPYTTILAKGGTTIFLTNSLTTATGSLVYNIEGHLTGISSTQ